MPATFDELGVRFLYPENWKVADRDESEEGPGVTLESPDGTFFSINRYRDRDDPQEIVRQAVTVMEGEYEQIESSAYEDRPDAVDEAGIELNFYCLDLLVTARFLALRDRGDVLLIQMQGENRSFDRNEAVFKAVLASLRQSL